MITIVDDKIAYPYSLVQLAVKMCPSWLSPNAASPYESAGKKWEYEGKNRGVDLATNYYATHTQRLSACIPSRAVCSTYVSEIAP